MTKTKISYATVNLDDSKLTYRVRHSRKARYLRLQINPQTGLEVVIPRGCNLEEAEKFVFKKKEWILRHLPSVTAVEEFMYLGTKIRTRQRYDLFLKKHRLTLNKDTLLIESPSGGSEDVNYIFNVWLKRRAKIYLPERTRILAEKYGFEFKKLGIRNQKTRWGSCSASGNISLNYRLMKYRKELIDYVIIHELCHLKELNHSKKFWKLVEAIIPEYKLLKKELRTHP